MELYRDETEREIYYTPDLAIISQSIQQLGKQIRQKLILISVEIHLQVLKQGNFSTLSVLDVKRRPLRDVALPLASVVM